METAGSFILLEMAGDPEPARIGCAQAVNNEGMISGWHVIEIGNLNTIDVVPRWDRAGKFIRSGAAGYAGSIWVIDMNDRGQILSRRETGGYDEVRVENSDWSGFMMPEYWYRAVTHDPVRMNRKGDVMATYCTVQR